MAGYVYLYIHYFHGIIINGVLLFLNLFMNFFYTVCLIFPPRGQRKQPLTFLLGLLIFCILSYCAFMITKDLLRIGYIFNYLLQYVALPFILSALADYCMVCYMWLNFYYYIQIVPPPCALFQWVKKNIKWTIYVLVVFDMLQNISCKIIVQVKYLELMFLDWYLYNETTITAMIDSYEQTRLASFILTMCQYSVMLCVTVMCSLSTVCYLHRHMKNMGKNGSSLSATNLRNQMRVTITGLCQGVLFLLYVSYLLFHDLSNELAEKFWVDQQIRSIVTTLFIFGTTVTIGVGQNIFRQRIVGMFKALKCLSICCICRNR